MAIFDDTKHPGGQTESVWQASFTVPEYPPLEHDIETDVCVVGAGIAGLTTAYMLAKAGKHVVVVDDGPIGGGETGRTTAHLTAAMDDRIYRLETVHGADNTRLIVESHMAAVNRIEAITIEERIDCDFRRLDGYLFAAEPTARGEDGMPSELEKELRAAHRAGMTDVQMVEGAPAGAFNTGPALRFPNSGQLHSLKYISGLAKAIGLMGGDIYCGSHVSEVQGGKSCTVKLENGKTITAKAVAVCTNGSISDYVQTHAKQAPYRTYVVGLPIARGTMDPILLWDTADPYHYVRLMAVGGEQWAARSAGLGSGVTDGHDVLIVGGEDHKTAHKDDAETRWRNLEAWARARWPQAGEVMYRWSGQVLEPADYIAFIGRNPDGAENVYMSSGDSGQGMTHGTIAGMVITDLVMGRKGPYEELYDPRRITLAMSPVEELLKENADVAVQYVKDFVSAGADENEITAGEGKVIRRGMHKVAAYRDESGSMHYCSAVCTHLKCVVGWNSAEKTWDCPCHGSRYDALGKVINGPALSDLEPAEPSVAPAKPAWSSRQGKTS
jgi:glycine/D-amino acid oxidase-like deaminating enzyme/nitrite reductase/ring-hydroxylating ferredoxin subunit